MDDKKWDAQTSEGILPASAPLANPYVPFQRKNPVRYEARRGIIRGTMYPGLDLPFMGMVNERELPETPLSELQMLGFAIQDLALYLDTHRDDAEALEVYREYQRIYQNAAAQYNRETPLSHTMASEGTQYDWLGDPWPWDYPHH